VCASAQVELDDAQDALSLLQVHVKKHAVAHNKDGPVDPYVDAQGRCCTADLSQRGQGVLGPCEGVAVGDNTLWWLRNELVDKRFPQTIAGPFRKMGLVDPSGRTIKQGYVKNQDSDSDRPDPNWQNPASWLNGPGYTIVNIQCGACADDGADGAAATGDSGCPAGQIPGDFYKTSGANAYCSDTGGFRLKDDKLCQAGLLGAVGFNRGLAAGFDCPSCFCPNNHPSVVARWPSPGCFQNTDGKLITSTCTRNTFDGSTLDGPHSGICFKCVPDPNDVPVDEGEAVDPGDEAAATGDPHITTNTGERFDVSSP